MAFLSSSNLLLSFSCKAAYRRKEGPQIIQDDLISRSSTWFYLGRPFFQIRSEIRTWMDFLECHHSTQYSAIVHSVSESWRFHSSLSSIIMIPFCQQEFLTQRFMMVSCMCAKSLQSCPTLCDPMDCSLPGSSVHGISKQEYWSGVPLLSPIWC